MAVLVEGAGQQIQTWACICVICSVMFALHLSLIISPAAPKKAPNARLQNEMAMIKHYKNGEMIAIIACCLRRKMVLWIIHSKTEHITLQVDTVQYIHFIFFILLFILIIMHKFIKKTVKCLTAVWLISTIMELLIWVYRVSSS